MPTIDRKDELRFDPEVIDVVLPPDNFSFVQRTIAGGPNMQALMSCQYALTIEESLLLSRMFHMRVPIVSKGNQREWPTGEVGMHMKVQLPILISGSNRRDDNIFDLSGPLILFGCRVPGHPDVKISSYSVQTREGKISVSRGLYMDIINLWMRNLLRTS